MSIPSSEQARFVLLEQWARAAAGAGFPVPTTPHLVAIAQSGGITPMLQRVREVGMWQPTIAWLVQQADAGTGNALSKLPQHLVRPSAGGANGAGGAGPATAPTAGTAAGVAEPSREERRFLRLRTWHQSAIGQGRPNAQGLRDMHLRLVANSHVTTATEIRAIFPPVVGQFADDLATVLAGTVLAGTVPADGAPGSGGAHPDDTAGGPRTAPGDHAPAAIPPGESGRDEGWVSAAVAATANHGRPADANHGAAMLPNGAPRHGEPGAGAGGARQAPEPTTPDLTVAPEGFAPYEFGPTDEEPLPITLRRRPEGGIALSWPARRPGGTRAAPGASGFDSDRDDRDRDDSDRDDSNRDDSDRHEPGSRSRSRRDARRDRADEAAGADDSFVVIDRLLTSDEYAPYSPDAARLVVTTRGTEGLDELEFGHAARHYQVWRNTGTSIADAKLSQPVKYASGELVSPVLDFDLREDEGRVIGQWRVLPGTNRVQVFRIPIQIAAGSSGDPQYRIQHDDDNLGGFVDATAARGQRYLYQVFAEAEFDGVARLSAPTNHDLLVSAIHEPVRDLSFELLDSDDEPLFDLSWTVPPGGQVVVFRTQQPPQPGIERQAIAVAALAQAGLPDERKQSHPIVTEGDRASMRHVPWPRGWTRAYFTTVVMLGANAFVGNTVRGVRVPKVSHPKLIERVNRQVLTFEWPEGADTVLAYSSMPGVTSEVAMQGQPIEVSRSDYREQGGLEFPRGRLDTKGCDLHLVSVAFDGGQRVLAAPEVVHYPGLLRIWYRIVTAHLADGRPLIRVQLLSETDVATAPPFVLVHNPDRLPLTVSDGKPVAVVPETSPNDPVQRRFVPSPLPSRGSVSTWVVEPSYFAREVRPTGFLRLFAALPPHDLARVALLDPHVGSLRLQPPQGPGGGMSGGLRG